MTRRLLSICLALLLCLSMFPAVSSAAESSEVFTLKTDKTSLKVDESITITVVGEQLSGLYASDIRVKYDSSRLKLEGSVVTNLSKTSGGFQLHVDGKQNPLMMVHTFVGQHPGISGDKTLYTLTFKAIQSGAAKVELVSVLRVDADLNAGEGTFGTGILSIDIREKEVQPVQVTGVSLDPNALSLVEGTSGQLNAAVAPANASNKQVGWTSSNEAVATVDGTGKVIAAGVGAATITVSTVDGGFNSSAEVTVTAAPVAVTGVSLDPDTLNLVEGSSGQLNATVAPANATNKQVSWTSSSEAVATVDGTGKVLAAGVGTATITVTTADGGFTMSAEVTVAAAPVAVTGVSLDQESLSLEKGSNQQLIATVAPADATNKQVTWSSSDSAVAAVDTAGKVTAQGVGMAIVNVTAVDGGATDFVIVYVTEAPVSVTGVSVGPETLTLVEGANGQLTATVSPVNATNAAVEWTTGNPAVATVDSTGKVTAKAPGTATITVTTVDGALTAAAEVTVTEAPVSVTGVSVDPEALTLVEGANGQLTATVSPVNATNAAVEWTTGNPDVATVDATGKVTAKAPGTATITVTTVDGGLTAAAEVTVTAAPVSVTGVSVDPEALTLVEGANGQLTATVSPVNATNAEVKWTTGNPAVATVDATGKVTAKAPGTATITVTTVDGGKKATATVTVTSRQTSPPPPPAPTPTPTPTPAPDQPVAIEVVPDESGVATATVSEDDFSYAMEHSITKSVKIEVSTTDDAKEVVVKLPAQQVGASRSNGISRIDVNTGLATISFDPKVLEDTLGTESADVQLSVAKVDTSTLSEEVRHVVGTDTIVYDFNLSVDGTKISTFKGNEVRVDVPYTLKPGEHPNKIVIYYITDDGKLEVVKNGKYNPATGRVEFKAKHFSKYTTAFVDVSYKDLASVGWAQDSIEGLAARSIVQGVGDGQFHPDGIVTRAEFITMLMNTFDLIDGNATTAWKDVEAGSWYYSAVASAQRLGIVQGTTTDAFGIEESITRQDMAVMLYRAVQHLGMTLAKKDGITAFADQASISTYALEAVETMNQTGLVEGVGSGRFAPQAQATRAQTAVILYRLLGYSE